MGSGRTGSLEGSWGRGVGAPAPREDRQIALGKGCSGAADSPGPDSRSHRWQPAVLGCLDRVLAGWYLQFCPSLDDGGGRKGEVRVTVNGKKSEEGREELLSCLNGQGGSGRVGVGGLRVGGGDEGRHHPKSSLASCWSQLLCQPVTPPAKAERRWREWVWDGGVDFERLEVSRPLSALWKQSRPGRWRKGKGRFRQSS